MFAPLAHHLFRLFLIPAPIHFSCGCLFFSNKLLIKLHADQLPPIEIDPTTKMKTAILLTWLMSLITASGQLIGNLQISEEDWNNVQTAADISLEIRRHPHHLRRRGSFDKLFRSIHARAALIQSDGRCFVAFKGRRFSSLQLKLPRRTRNYCMDGDCCLVQRKWQKELGNLLSRIKPELDACVNNYCSTGNCTVITGHGIGGSLAALAAMSLKEYNPFGITFGELQAVETPCPLIESERWWRFINTEQVGRSLVYDRLASRRYSKFPLALGHTLLLSSVDRTAVAHMGKDRAWDFDPSDIRISPGQRTDSMSKYHDSISAITAAYTANLSYPIAPDGFDDGTYCSFGGECQSRLCGERNGQRLCIA